MVLPSLPEGEDPVRCDVPGWETRLVEALSDRGIAVYRNLHDRAQLLGLASELGEVFYHRDGDHQGFTDVSSGTAGSLSPSQFLHTDSAGEETPPDLLVVHCITPADSGGHSILADAVRFCQVLATDYREAFEALTDPSIGAIRSGKKVYRGPFLTRLTSDLHYFRFRPDNEEVSPVLAEHLTTIIHAAGTVTEGLVLPAGSGYVARNERWLHGRTSWSGHREALRLLINVSTEKPLGARVPERGFRIGI